jgi:hypothetical protein
MDRDLGAKYPQERVGVQGGELPICNNMKFYSMCARGVAVTHSLATWSQAVLQQLIPTPPEYLYACVKCSMYISTVSMKKE